MLFPFCFAGKFLKVCVQLFSALNVIVATICSPFLTFTTIDVGLILSASLSSFHTLFTVILISSVSCVFVIVYSGADVV